MPEITLTDPEWNLIKKIRAEKLDFGRIPCIIYIQDKQLIRVEMEKFTESTKLN
jgi:hypothetical protein|tara:strand:+ start:597 stop:758 length:162 start_codon:yes stop_codon:yes gene_type:complete